MIEQNERGGRSMKLTTWNVNGIRSVLNKGALQEYVLEAQPDILCLQETKAQPEQVDLGMEFAGYHAYWNSAVKKRVFWNSHFYKGRTDFCSIWIRN